MQIKSGAVWQQQCKFCNGRHTDDEISYSLTYQGCLQPHKFLGMAYVTLFSRTLSPEYKTTGRLLPTADP